MYVSAARSKVLLGPGERLGRGPAVALRLHLTRYDGEDADGDVAVEASMPLQRAREFWHQLGQVLESIDRASNPASVAKGEGGAVPPDPSTAIGEDEGIPY